MGGIHSQMYGSHLIHPSVLTPEGVHEHHNTAQKFTNTVTATYIFTMWFQSPHLQRPEIILLCLNSSPQNKHITTLVITAVLILMMHVNLFLCLKVWYEGMKSMNMTDLRSWPEKLLLPSDKTIFPGTCTSWQFSFFDLWS